MSSGVRRGFTLVEMLVVIGIIAVLVGIGMNTFSGATSKAQQARAQAIVGDVATALEAILNKEGAFPRRVIAEGSSDGELDENVSYALAKHKVMSLAYDDNGKVTIGADRCGVLTPWAQDVVTKSASASSGTAVPSGGTVKDHIVHFAVDIDGDGKVSASVGGESLTIRASAVAWCCGRDGKMYPYSEGARRGCSYSWSMDKVVK